MAALIGEPMCFSGDYTDLFLTLSDDVDDVIQTEHILITDVSQSSGDTLVFDQLESKEPSVGFTSLQEVELPRNFQNRPNYFGWNSEIGHEFGYDKLTLLKEIDTVPIEGGFTCRIEEAASPQSFEEDTVGIHYPK